MYTALVLSVCAFLIIGGIAGVIELCHYDNGHLYDEEMEEN